MGNFLLIPKEIHFKALKFPIHSRGKSFSPGDRFPNEGQHGPTQCGASGAIPLFASRAPGQIDLLRSANDSADGLLQPRVQCLTHSK